MGAEVGIGSGAGRQMHLERAQQGVLLDPHNFSLGPIRSGAGSGGSFASCEFVRVNRRLRLHFRYSLGLVEYQVGEVRIPHEDYMWAVRGERRATNYPGFQRSRSTSLDAWRLILRSMVETSFTEMIAPLPNTRSALPYCETMHRAFPASGGRNRSVPQIDRRALPFLSGRPVVGFGFGRPR